MFAAAVPLGRFNLSQTPITSDEAKSVPGTDLGEELKVPLPNKPLDFTFSVIFFYIIIASIYSIGRNAIKRPSNSSN